MSRGAPRGPPPAPPTDLHSRPLPLHTVAAGSILSRIHRTARDPLHFGRPTHAWQRQRWDAPDGSYGVCYLAFEAHIGFAETMLRDLALNIVHDDDLRVRSLARVEASTPLRLVKMHGSGLRPIGADASVVHGPYPLTWVWSGVLYTHPTEPDGICYRARHDDSGLSVALFDRAHTTLSVVESIPLTAPILSGELTGWLDRYRVGLIY